MNEQLRVADRAIRKTLYFGIFTFFTCTIFFGALSVSDRDVAVTPAEETMEQRIARYKVFPEEYIVTHRGCR
jgi:hypothetical protein